MKHDNQHKRLKKIITSRRYFNPCWEVLLTQLQWQVQVVPHSYTIGFGSTNLNVNQMVKIQSAIQESEKRKLNIQLGHYPHPPKKIKNTPTHLAMPPRPRPNHPQTMKVTVFSQHVSSQQNTTKILSRKSYLPILLCLEPLRLELFLCVDT